MSQQQHSSDGEPEFPVISNKDMVLASVSLKGKRVVDIGCGDGRLARLMADEGDAQQVIGIECSPRQLAKAAAQPPHPRVEVREGVGEALPLEDGSAEVALFFNSLHHVPAAAMATALKEAARVVGPAGMICSVEPIARGAFFALCQPVHDETIVRAQAQEALMKALRDGMSLDRRLTYLNPVRIRSYEDFQDRLLSASPSLTDRFAAQDAQMRALYAQTLAGPDCQPDGAGGALFLQPSILTLLRCHP